MTRSEELQLIKEAVAAGKCRVYPAGLSEEVDKARQQSRIARSKRGATKRELKRGRKL